MSRARDFADLAGSADAGGITGRNLIINGAMQVAQRGTSFADLSGYGLDRFQVGSSDDGAVTVTQDTTVPSGQGFKNSMKFDVTTADTSIGAAQYYQFFQKIEGQNVAHLMFGTSDAKSITLSFWCRSNKTGTYSVNFMNNAADRFNPNNFTINSADTWEKKTITVSGDTTGTWLTTNGIGLYVIWNLALGSNYQDGTNGTWGSADYASGAIVNFLDSTSNEFYITGVQLEVGDKATPFEHRSFGEELALCQRYYEQVGNGAPALANSTTQFWTGYTFKTEKRVAATASVIAADVRYFKFGLANRDNSSPSIGQAYYQTGSALIRVDGFSSLTANESAMTGGTTGDTSAKMFAFDAEL